MMNILITAGGTCENIDSVRTISNNSTGRLGSIIADVFAKEDAKITYVCGETALLPNCKDIEIIKIRSVGELVETMETLLNKSKYDCVIHSMAVSDFTPQAVLSIDEMIEAISREMQTGNIPQNEIPDRVKTAVFQCVKPLNDKKISSTASDVAILLKQTPKVIERIKAIQPQTILVGFKLLSNVSEEELLQAAQNIMKKSKCDFVLANDLKNINSDRHTGILIKPDSSYIRLHTKQEIAQAIADNVKLMMNNSE